MENLQPFLFQISQPRSLFGFYNLRTKKGFKKRLGWAKHDLNLESMGEQLDVNGNQVIESGRDRKSLWAVCVQGSGGGRIQRVFMICSGRAKKKDSFRSRKRSWFDPPRERRNQCIKRLSFLNCLDPNLCGPVQMHITLAWIETWDSPRMKRKKKKKKRKEKQWYRLVVHSRDAISSCCTWSANTKTISFDSRYTVKLLMCLVGMGSETASWPMMPTCRSRALLHVMEAQRVQCQP